MRLIKRFISLIPAFLLSVAIVGAQTCPGVCLRPQDDVNAIMRATAPGALFTFSPGMYRVGDLPIESGDTLQGTGDAVLTGADSAVWTATGSLTYVIAWPYDFGLWTVPQGWPNMADLSRRREVLWVNGARLTQILNCSALSLGQYCVDETADRITFRTADTVLSVEAAVRPYIINASGVKNVTIRGLIFRGSSSFYNSAAVSFHNADNLRIENSLFDQHNGGGFGVTLSRGGYPPGKHLQ